MRFFSSPLRFALLLSLAFVFVLPASSSLAGYINTNDFTIDDFQDIGTVPDDITKEYSAITDAAARDKIRAYVQERYEDLQVAASQSGSFSLQADAEKYSDLLNKLNQAESKLTSTSTTPATTTPTTTPTTTTPATTTTPTTTTPTTTTPTTTTPTITTPATTTSATPATSTTPATTSTAEETKPVEEKKESASLLAFPTILPSTGELVAKIQTGDIHFIDIPKFIGYFIKFLLEIAGALAVLMIVYGGFQYVMSGFSPDKKDAAKSTITYAIVGLVLSFSAWIIVDLVVSLATGG